MADKISIHNWPVNDEHVWGPWMQKTSTPPFIQYRMCVHPTCSGTEERNAPMGPME